MDTLPLNKVPREVREEAARGISDYVVGFVRVHETKLGEDAELAGSGTLVQIEGTDAILTAHHVLHDLRDVDEIGLVLPARFEPSLHRVKLRTQLLCSLKVARGKEESEGPDLGLLILPKGDTGSLRAKKSFYNLSYHRERMLHNPPAQDEGVWFLSGFAGERTSEGMPERGYSRVKEFRGDCGVVCVEREYCEKGFDYLEVKTRHGGRNGPPQSFGGFSGGGLWQVPLARCPGGTLKAKEPLLSGLAFYEFPPVEDSRIVKCHGRRSVYLRAIQAVRNSAPEQGEELGR